MLSVFGEILTILGILLLCLLGLAVLVLLLLLFYPVTYRITAKKDAKQISVRAGASWLLGFLRVSCCYPEPGKVLVKLLPFTVFDSSSAGQPATPEGGTSSAGRSSAADSRAETGDTEEKKQEKGQADVSVDQSHRKPNDDPESEKADAGAPSQENKKFKKIKYTICSIYDKIKNIWENISYYIELLQEEETRQLFSHATFRLGRILKNIRPKKIRGRILFGTGSPDTTGYAYGIYGMISPVLGYKLLVTPDFSRAVLEGDVYIAGHITVFTILWNSLRVLLDKKLRRFIRKIKSGRKR